MSNILTRGSVEHARDALAAAAVRVHGEATSDGLDQAARGGEQVVVLRAAEHDAPVPLVLFCPKCGARHIDEGENATTSHRTHACQACGFLWAPAVVPTIGVRFLPGCKNDDAQTQKRAEDEHFIRLANHVAGYVPVSCEKRLQDTEAALARVTAERDAMRASGAAPAEPRPQYPGVAEIDPRPLCIQCGRRWLPGEGVDATQVPCGQGLCRSKEWWLKRADSEGDSCVGVAGGAVAPEAAGEKPGALPEAVLWWSERENCDGFTWGAEREAREDVDEHGGVWGAYVDREAAAATVRELQAERDRAVVDGRNLRAEVARLTAELASSEKHSVDVMARRDAALRDVDRLIADLARVTQQVELLSARSASAEVELATARRERDEARAERDPAMKQLRAIGAFLRLPSDEAIGNITCRVLSVVDELAKLQAAQLAARGEGQEPFLWVLLNPVGAFVNAATSVQEAEDMRATLATNGRHGSIVPVYRAPVAPPASTDAEALAGIRAAIGLPERGALPSGRKVPEPVAFVNCYRDEGEQWLGLSGRTAEEVRGNGQGVNGRTLCALIPLDQWDAFTSAAKATP